MKDYAVQELHLEVSALVAERMLWDTIEDAVFIKRNLAVPQRW